MFFIIFCSRFKLLSTGQTPRYSNWRENEPNNGDGENEDCVTIPIYDTSEKWNDAPCSVDYNSHVCEIEL